MNSLAVASRLVAATEHWPGSEELDSFVTVFMIKRCTSDTNNCVALTKGVHLCTLMVNSYTY